MIGRLRVWEERELTREAIDGQKQLIIQRARVGAI